MRPFLSGRHLGRLLARLRGGWSSDRQSEDPLTSRLVEAKVGNGSGAPV